MWQPGWNRVPLGGQRYPGGPLNYACAAHQVLEGIATSPFSSKPKPLPAINPLAHQSSDLPNVGQWAQHGFPTPQYSWSILGDYVIRILLSKIKGSNYSRACQPILLVCSHSCIWKTNQSIEQWFHISNKLQNLSWAIDLYLLCHTGRTQTEASIFQLNSNTLLLTLDNIFNNTELPLSPKHLYTSPHSSSCQSASTCLQYPSKYIVTEMDHQLCLQLIPWHVYKPAGSSLRLHAFFLGGWSSFKLLCKFFHFFRVY